jgi:hypothetical protein
MHSPDARRLLGCIRSMQTARNCGFGDVYLRNMKLARVIAARLIAGKR